jgi:hypothetical protein
MTIIAGELRVSTNRTPTWATKAKYARLYSLDTQYIMFAFLFLLGWTAFGSLPYFHWRRWRTTELTLNMLLFLCLSCVQCSYVYFPRSWRQFYGAIWQKISRSVSRMLNSIAMVTWMKVVSFNVVRHAGITTIRQHLIPNGFVSGRYCEACYSGI